MSIKQKLQENNFAALEDGKLDHSNGLPES